MNRDSGAVGTGRRRHRSRGARAADGSAHCIAMR
jgi:hypothetical protein